MNIVKTRLKIRHAIFKLILGFGGIFILLVSLIFINELIKKPSMVSFLAFLMYSGMGFFFMGFGFISIKTFSINENYLNEIYFGIIKFKTQISDIEFYKCRKQSNKLGFFDELVINKGNGQTIFIQSFDQTNFYNFQKAVDKYLVKNDSIKPNEWTIFIRIVVSWLAILVITMIITFCVGK